METKEDLQCDQKACLFPRGLGIFELNFLSQFLTKMRSFCAHQKGNFLNFSKLTLLLYLVHSWCPQWPIKRYRAFFLGHPVYTHFVRETRRERILENLKKTLKIKEKQSKMIGKNVSTDQNFYIWQKLSLQKRQRSMKSFERRNITKNMGIQLTMQKRDSSKLSKKRERRENQSILN